MTYALRTQVNPNNELRTTLYPVVKKRVTLRDQAAAFLSVAPEEVERRASSNPGSDVLLDIRSEFKTNKIQCNAQAFQRTSFGHSARTRLMRAAGALDRLDANPSHYLFLTATLPSDSEWAKWAIAADAHNLINGFKAWLSKRVKSRYEFYVWELQGRQALHFHYCIHVPDRVAHEAIARDFRAEWMRLLDGMTARTGVCAWGKHANLSYKDKYAILQTRAETIYSSVGRYMAGYTAGNKDKHCHDRDSPFYPKRWFGVSRDLSRLVQEFSEEEITDYPNYREAKIAFDETNRYFEQDSLTSKTFPHKVGVGETGVHYHSLQNLTELWQQRKAMIFNQKQYPNTSFFIKRILLCTQMISQLTKESQLFREISSKMPIDSLRDGLLTASLRRGSLHDSQIKAIETLWLELNSRSNLPRSLTLLSTALKHCILTYSQNYPKIQWNRHGWMCLTTDFDNTVDSTVKNWQTGTTPTEGATPLLPDSSRGHVPSEPKSEAQQLSVI